MVATVRSRRIEKLAQYFTAKFGGKCWAGYDDSKRKYYISGENLPAAPELTHLYPNGWSLLDYFSARQVDKLGNQQDGVE